MKNFLITSMIVLAGILVSTNPLSAVYPPAPLLELEKEEVQPAPEQVHQTLQQLRQDEARLAEILRSLEEDERHLRDLQAPAAGAANDPGQQEKKPALAP